MSSFAIITGRFLLGLYFLIPGLAKIFAPASQLELMQAQGIAAAQPLLLFAGISSSIGALALMSGRFVKFAAYGLALYVLLVNVMIHPFWNIESETQNFFKNLGILSGLLVLGGYAPARWPTPQGWWESDAAAKRG
jgi:putative oxidoreductase